MWYPVCKLFGYLMRIQQAKCMWYTNSLYSVVWLTLTSVYCQCQSCYHFSFLSWQRPLRLKLLEFIPVSCVVFSTVHYQMFESIQSCLIDPSLSMYIWCYWCHGSRVEQVTLGRFSFCIPSSPFKCPTLPQWSYLLLWELDHHGKTQSSCDSGIWSSDCKRRKIIDSKSIQIHTMYMQETKAHKGK